MTLHVALLDGVRSAHWKRGEVCGQAVSAAHWRHRVEGGIEAESPSRHGAGWWQLQDSEAHVSDGHHRAPFRDEVHRDGYTGRHGDRRPRGPTAPSLGVAPFRRRHHPCGRGSSARSAPEDILPSIRWLPSNPSGGPSVLGRKQTMTTTVGDQTNANRETVREAFEAWKSRTGSITDVFAPEMVWRIEGHSVASKRYESKQQFIDEVLGPFGARFSASADPFRPVTIRSMHAEIGRASCRERV